MFFWADLLQCLGFACREIPTAIMNTPVFFGKAFLSFSELWTELMKLLLKQELEASAETEKHWIRLKNSPKGSEMNIKKMW